MSDSAAGGIQDVVDRVAHVACGPGRCVGEAREVIRAQPIAAALVVLTLGYLLGRLGSLIPSRR